MSEGTGAGARETPYELVFGAGGYEGSVFPGIREEAGARRVDAEDPQAFVQLTSVGSLLQALLPEDAPGSAVAEVGQLVYHAFHFWLSGRKLVVVDPALARRLLAAPPRVGDWPFTAPHPAGYLQLPRHLLWARVSEEAPAEAVDGIFWTLAGAGARVELLLVLGVRPGRGGFTVAEVSARVPEIAPGHWGDQAARGGGVADFSSVLPGGELSSLHSLVAPLEVLKLVSLLFRQAERPGALQPLAAGPDSALSCELLRDDLSGG